MRYAGVLYLFFMFLTMLAQGAPMHTVKFTPVVTVHECPPVFKHKSECLAHTRKLEPVKLYLSIEVLNQVMGRWSHDESAPVPSSFYVIVLRNQVGTQAEYSVSSEAGLNGSSMPFNNARVEFSDSTLPRSFGVSGAPLEKDGKKYITELRITDFHGRLLPAAVPKKSP